jgi:hypothetical protein
MSTPPPDQEFGFGPRPDQEFGFGPRRRRTGKFIALGIVGLLIIGGIAVGLWEKASADSAAQLAAQAAARTDPADSAAGGCLSGDLHDPGSVKQAVCTSGNAGYQVLAVLADRHRSDYDSDRVCTDVPHTDTVYWEGHSDDAEGTILCLRKLTG